MRWKRMNLTFSTHLKLLKNIIGARSCGLSKIDQIQKIENRKIEKNNLISIENFRIFGFSDFRFSKNFNWNPSKIFRFSKFSIFDFWNLKSKNFDPTFFWRRIFQIGQKINDRLALEIRSFLESFPVRATAGDVFLNVKTCLNLSKLV